MMLKLFVILVFAAVVFGDNSTTSSLMTSTSKAKSVTPTSTATAKLTITATSTATAVTTTTPKPNTTAVSTTTPTTSNTTASHPTISPTKTTAPPPTTTTTASPTVTPTAPGKFSLKKNGSYCILAEFEASFTIQYYFMANKTTIRRNSLTEVLNSTTQDHVNISGNCGLNEENATLILSWPFYVFTMEFKGQEAASPSSNMTSWMVSKITFKVNLTNNPSLTYPLALVNNEPSVLGTYNGSSGPSGHVSGSYLCADKTPFPLSSDVNNITITSAFKHMRLEPFVEKKDALDFNKNDTNDCYQDHPTTTVIPTTKSSDNDIVPIAVGCALAGLVLIVLIAYVIGRRKSHSGYEKV